MFYQFQLPWEDGKNIFTAKTRKTQEKAKIFPTIILSYNTKHSNMLYINPYTNVYMLYINIVLFAA